jgi:N,N-dimethylformamidase
VSWVNEMATVKVFGYADKFAASHGDTIDFMVSVEGTDSYRAEIVKLLHGSGDPTGPGFRELPVESAVSGDYTGRPQSTIAGSYVLVSEVDVLGFTGDFSLHAFVYPTVPTRGPQVILARWNDRSELGVALTSLNS